jgi:hypothetical protein
MTSADHLAHVQALVRVRQAQNGVPALNHGCTAALWSAYWSRKLGMGITVTKEDVIWLNILQKISREASNSLPDNADDVVGYVLNLWSLDEPQGPRGSH